MATVTGLTAARMLEIEAASVVDGDVVGDNLILTKHDGSTINAGSVRGPQGDPGPIGSDLSVLASVPILEVGQANQIKAGRQLAASDFTDMGLAAPVGLWNFSNNANDSSGNGRNLVNKGAISFVSGINGAASTAAKFTGSTAQALYIADTGVNDPFRIRTGSFGCWFKSERRGTSQEFISKCGINSSDRCSWLFLYSSGSNSVLFQGAPDGTAATASSCNGVSDVVDGKWHFIVATVDGNMICVYIDGVLENVSLINGPLFAGSAPLNVGSINADAATAGYLQNYGKLDEVFITTDVLSEDEVRNLYCVKIAHTLAAVPSRASLIVRRRRRGAALVAGDFPAQPVRLHNFSGGSLGDEGSSGVGLTNNGAALAIAGADGFAGNAFDFEAAQSLSSTDAGLPNGTSQRSYGCWFKTNKATGNMGLVSWGGGSGLNIGGFLGIGTGVLIAQTAGFSNISGPFVADGQWHHAVVTEVNAVGGTTDDGVKIKLYLDGRLVAISTNLGSITLGGANRFRIGACGDGTLLYTGQIDAAFVCAQTLTSEQIWTLFNKSSQQLAASPKNVGDHVEAMDATNIAALFDSLDSQNRIDLAVAA